MRTDDKRKRPGMHTYYNNILILLVLNISMELTFIDYLKTELKNLDDTGADFDRNLMHFPNIVELLCDLLDEDVVDQESRLMINAALGGGKKGLCSYFKCDSDYKTCLEENE